MKILPAHQSAERSEVPMHRDTPQSRPVGTARRPLRTPHSTLHTGEDGIALIIVMISIFVLTILAGGFAYSMKVETKLARNANSEVALEWMGRSTLEYVCCVLANRFADPLKAYDSPSQPWFTGHGTLGSSNSPSMELMNPILFDNGSTKGQVTWKLVDLESKININVLANPQNPQYQNMLQQVLMVMGLDAGELTPISNCILDWMDRSSLKSSRPQGAKNEYYGALDPPYDAKNGPIDDLSELLLVKGITPELYWGTSSTNHPPGAFLPRVNRFGQEVQGPVYTAGLAEIFTPISTGKINILTASQTVLQIVCGGDPTIAEQIVQARSVFEQDDQEGTIHTGPPSVGQILFDACGNRQLAQQLAPYFDLKSHAFEVTMDAEANGYHRTFKAVLGLGLNTGPREVQVLNFYWQDSAGK